MISEDKEVEQEYLDKGLTLIAVFGIKDPLRPGIKEAIVKC